MKEASELLFSRSCPGSTESKGARLSSERAILSPAAWGLEGVTVD